MAAIRRGIRKPCQAGNRTGARCRGGHSISWTTGSHCQQAQGMLGEGEGSRNTLPTHTRNREVEKTGEPGCSWRGSVGCRYRGARLPQRPPSAAAPGQRSQGGFPTSAQPQRPRQTWLPTASSSFLKKIRKTVTGDRASTLWFTPWKSTAARAGPGQSWESASPAWSAT